MIEVKYPRVLNKNELHEFKKHWVDAFRENCPRGMYLMDSYIYVVASSPNDSIGSLHVYSYAKNQILIGEFKPDHGAIWGNNGEGIYAYCPIIVFYNQLNYLPAYGAFNVGVPNNTCIECTKEGITINELNLLETVRDSWNYLRIFDKFTSEF